MRAWLAQGTVAPRPVGRGRAERWQHGSGSGSAPVRSSDFDGKSRDSLKLLDWRGPALAYMLLSSVLNGAGTPEGTDRVQGRGLVPAVAKTTTPVVT